MGTTTLLKRIFEVPIHTYLSNAILLPIFGTIFGLLGRARASTMLFRTEEKIDNAADDNFPPPVSTREARNCLKRLRLFFMQEGNEESPIASLDNCSDSVQR